METKTIAELGIKITPETGSYWNHNGAYQEEGDRLFEEMVPAAYAASTRNGELIRAINRLTYEYLNNGNCNAAEVHYVGEHEYDEEMDDPEEIESVEIDAYYLKFIELIENSLIEKIDSKEVNEVMNRVREIIEDQNTSQNYCHDYFSAKNVNVYSRMADMVIWFVLNTEDEDLPQDYARN